MRPLLACIAAVSLLSSCDKSPWGLDNTCHHTVRWQYNGSRYEMAISVPAEFYRYYDSLPKNMPYERYSSECPERPYLAEVAGMLSDKADRASIPDEQLAAFVLAFVQSIGYVSHDERVQEYTQYPILTLLRGGNCLDLSILYASLCETLGIETVLVTVPWHMFVGVSCRGCTGYAYMFRNRKYYAAECTAEGWKVGEISPDVDTSSTVTIIDVPRPAAFNRPVHKPSGHLVMMIKC